jgi:hypothetical protein
MLYIIGTGHHYQFGEGTQFGKDLCTREDEAAFVRMLRETTARLSIRVMAEELNPQAFTEVGKSASVLQIVAAQLALPHLFCEPDSSERDALGIWEENAIRVSAFPKELDKGVVQALIAQSWSRREQEWLRRLEETKAENVLFLCGSDHIPTFVALARDHGFESIVVDPDWTAR